jgi:GAF domain-containing protein
VVPLQVVGRTIGVLTLTSEQQHRYTDADVELVEDLARRMATAVDNACATARSARRPDAAALAAAAGAARAARA